MTDAKITALTALTDVNKADLFAVVDDVAGSPITKKATVNSALGAPVDHRDFDQTTSVANPATGDTRLYSGTDGKMYIRSSAGAVTAVGEGVLSHNIFGRITAATNDPFNIDGTADAETLYFTPCNGNMARMYDATLTAWKYLTFSQLTLLITDDTQTGDITNGSAVVSDLTSTALLAVGMVVSGTGIPAGAVISTIDSATQITMDQNATATTNDLSDLEFAFPASTNWIFAITISSGAVAIERPVVYTTQANLLTKITKLDGVKVLTGNTDAIVVGTFTVSSTAGQVDNTITDRNIRNIYQPLPRGFGWHPAWLPASALRPPNTNGAGALEQLSNGVVVRAFPYDAITYADIQICLPTGAAGSVAFDFIVYHSDTDAGNTQWAAVLYKNDEGTTQSLITTLTSTAGGIGATLTRKTLSISPYSISDYAPNTMLFIKFARRGGQVLDTYDSTAYLAGVRMYYLMYADGIEEV